MSRYLPYKEHNIVIRWIKEEHNKIDRYTERQIDTTARQIESYKMIREEHIKMDRFIERQLVILQLDRQKGRQIERQIESYTDVQMSTL